MDKWVRKQYRKGFCAEDGKLVAPVVDLDAFTEHLKLQRPNEAEAITTAVRKLDVQICSEICRDLPLDTEGRFIDAIAARKRLQERRPDLKEKKWRKAMVKRIEEDKVAALKVQTQTTDIPKPVQGSSKHASVKDTDEQLYQWIQTQYETCAFTSVGFVGWSKFQAALTNKKPQQRDQINSALQRLRRPGHAHSLENPDEFHRRSKSVVQQKPKQQPSQQKDGVHLAKREAQTAPVDHQSASKKVPHTYIQPLKPVSPKSMFTADGSSIPLPALIPSTKTTPTKIASAKNASTKKNVGVMIDDVKVSGISLEHETPNMDHITRELQRFQVGSQNSNASGTLPEAEMSIDAVSVAQITPWSSTPDFVLYSQLLGDNKKSNKAGGKIKCAQRDVEQAPLLGGNIIAQHANDLVPQFGLLGSLANQEPSLLSSQLFLNTNVPLSTFICGVQGSGKSHTTSCILKNAVIPSRHLGQLKSPVSTLVFSYGEWSSGGAGFNISEATYLTAPGKVVPGHRVKRITVLTSPSNPAINRLYQRHPNVRIIPFRLKAKTLDISALRTLMAIDEKSTVPLYMAKVESILRSIAAKSMDGSLDYIKFKQALKLESFDPTQTNMLEMRLNLLESFLDLTDKAPQPDFLPGEITIMDLSDAFVSPNTACILFKLGLEHFLQCAAPGKLVVLDEAHKYMLNTPGSKVLTEYLTRVIRFQRHLGARVVISTQEPTVSTDLIALCSVTVIHRFTSPAWYNALKKHINAMDDDEKIMHDIEGLETGEAFVYAPNAVLDKNEDGTLVKATGRLLKVNIRDRVTLDGGESIMAI